MRIGLISDTHGLLRPAAIAALQGSELILHAGDVGDSEVLEELRALAPVVAVRGNTDRGSWADSLPSTETVEVEGLYLLLLHDRSRLDFVPARAGIAAVVSGHSHRPSIVRRGGVLWINPGSAGPRRFSLPVTVARMQVEPGRIDAQIVELLPGRGRGNDDDRESGRS